jgi:hypothetical protein
MKYDLFICHAHEDKDDFVAPLVDRLSARGLRIWYDDFVLQVGDSLRKSIDQGLTDSRYAAVILSKSFFGKDWPNWELDGLLARQISGKKVILPIWHGVTAEEVRRFSPPLADKLALNSSNGLDSVVDGLLRVVAPVTRPDLLPQKGTSAKTLVDVFKSSVVYGKASASYDIGALFGSNIQEHGLVLIVEPGHILNTPGRAQRVYKVTSTSYEPLLIVHQEELATRTASVGPIDGQELKIEVTVQVAEPITNPLIRDLLNQIKVRLLRKPSRVELAEFEKLYSEYLHAEKIKEAWEDDPCYYSADYDRANSKYQTASANLDKYRSLMETQYPEYGYKFEGSFTSKPVTIMPFERDMRGH